MDHGLIVDRSGFTSNETNLLIGRSVTPGGRAQVGWSKLSSWATGRRRRRMRARPSVQTLVEDAMEGLAACRGSSPY
jgi:hypothetical protein